MRTDENGEQCPATLGEYRDLCVAVSPFGDRSAAVKFLDEKIVEFGRDEVVIAADSQMRMVLFPMMMGPA